MKLEAHVNMHLQSYVKKTRGIDADLTELDARGDRHRAKIGALNRKQARQGELNSRVEERMARMGAAETRINGVFGLHRRRLEPRFSGILGRVSATGRARRRWP